ncbi:MAG: hypothetical protein ACQEW8_01660 [Actinomycetota bacterium]
MSARPSVRSDAQLSHSSESQARYRAEQREDDAEYEHPGEPGISPTERCEGEASNRYRDSGSTSSR